MLVDLLKFMDEPLAEDIAWHLPTLYWLARTGCGDVIELGVRNGFSTIALLAGASERGRQLYSYDIDPTCEWRAMATWSKHMPLLRWLVGNHWRFRSQDSVAAAYDWGVQHGPSWRRPGLLFVDTSHGYDRTLAELRAWHDKLSAKSVICGHDYSLPSAGVRAAVATFCEDHRGQYTMQSTDHTNGLFILRRIDQ